MAAYDRLIKEIKNGAKRAMHRSTVEALRYARGISQGPFSTAELAKMDHPYARRHGTIRAHPVWINRQSGRFIEAWRVLDVNRIQNPTYYASWLLQGTHYMLPRAYADAILSTWLRMRASEVQREMARIGVPTRAHPE